MPYLISGEIVAQNVSGSANHFARNLRHRRPGSIDFCAANCYWPVGARKHRSTEDTRQPDGGRPSTSFAGSQELQ